jgi:thioesterase domain-containing protein
MYLRLRRRSPVPGIVIQKNEIEYLSPIVTNFFAEARLTAGIDWDYFLQMLERKKKARASVEVTVRSDRKNVAFFRGVYVALFSQGHAQ